MKSVEDAANWITDLISWVRDRPYMYGRTIGEIDTLLHYLHFVWAGLADVRDDFERIRIDLIQEMHYGPAAGLLDDADRVVLIDPQHHSPALARVLAYWTAVGERLDMKHLHQRPQ